MGDSYQTAGAINRIESNVEKASFRQREFIINIQITAFDWLASRLRGAGLERHAVVEPGNAGGDGAHRNCKVEARWFRAGPKSDYRSRDRSDRNRPACNNP